MPTISSVKAMVEKGPPKEPCSRSPGRILSAWHELCEKYHKDNQEMSVLDAVGLLAHVVDMVNYEGELRAYNEMKAALGQVMGVVGVERPKLIVPR